ncbi:MAG: hypothetical protein QXD88_00440 [Candidatus Anstonellales archaeon]
MRAQISLEFLYTNSIAIIITLFLVAILISYYSGSFALPDRCVTPYFLRCEDMFINSSNIIINLRNNFDYDIKITRLKLNDTEHTINIQLDRGKNSTINIPVSIPLNRNYAERLEIYYEPIVPNTPVNSEFVLYGRIYGRVRE